MSEALLERGPQRREGQPELPVIDDALRERLERRLSKPFDEFRIGELVEEAYRLLQEAHRKSEAEQDEEDWQALWWFNRRAEQKIFEATGTQEWVGEMEQYALAYDHVHNEKIRDDIDAWYDRHRRSGMPTTMTEFAELVEAAD